MLEGGKHVVGPIRVRGKNKTKGKKSTLGNGKKKGWPLDPKGESEGKSYWRSCPFRH